MKSIQFTADEKKLLVECLLFSSMIDICAEWTPKQNQDMIDLAKKINDSNVRLDSIYIFDKCKFDNPKIVAEVVKEFPNLPHTSIIEN